MRAVNGPCTSSPCTVLHRSERASTLQTRKNTTYFPMPSAKALVHPPDLLAWHSIFMHTCTIYVCTLHAASALNSALCVSSRAYVMYNVYVGESLTAPQPSPTQRWRGDVTRLCPSEAQWGSRHTRLWRGFRRHCLP